MSPWSPSVAALPGGLTPGFAAPMPPNDWTFQFTGFMNVTAQFGISKRPTPAPGQSEHRLPRAAHQPSTSTSRSSAPRTVPGNWVQMNFRYGNRDVTANLTLSTWNPSQPTTFYQLGSQGFVNNAFLTYNVGAARQAAAARDARLLLQQLRKSRPVHRRHVHDALRRRPCAASAACCWPTIQLTPELSFVVEGGIMGNRNGRSPAGIAPANPNNNVDPLFGSAYIQHLHAGLIRKTDVTLRATLHWMVNWGQDDRPQYDVAGNRDEATTW